MKRILVILLAAVLLFAFSGCTSQDTPSESKETAATTETTEATEATTAPVEVTKQLTQVVCYYENGDSTQYNLTYNEDGLFTGLEGSGRTYTYSEDGKLLWNVWGDVVDAMVPGENTGNGYEYNEQGQLVKEFFWEGGYYETIHEYDSTGVRIKSTSDGGMFIDIIEYVYNEDGLLTHANVTAKKVAGHENGNLLYNTTEYTECYDYSYKPFVAISRSDSSKAKLTLCSDDGISLFEHLPSFSLTSSQCYWDNDGYLVKLVDEEGTYEFYYDGEKAAPVQQEEPAETQAPSTEVAPTEAPTTEQAQSTSQVATNYTQILDMYYESISCQWTNQDRVFWNDAGERILTDPDSVCLLLWHYHDDDTLSDVGYALMDLNGDGQDELLISRMESANSGMIYQLYTIANGKVVSLISAVERDRYNLAKDGTILNDGSGSAATGSRINYYLDPVTCELKIRAGVSHDYSQDENNPYFSVSDGWNETKISNEEAHAILDAFPEQAALALTPFSQYK